MHTTKRLWGLGLIAILVAACSTTGGQASAESPTIASAPPVTEAPASEAASPSAEAEGEPEAGADRDAGDLHDRHRQSGLPALLRDRRSARHRSVGAG